LSTSSSKHLMTHYPRKTSALKRLETEMPTPNGPRLRGYALSQVRESQALVTCARRYVIVVWRFCPLLTLRYSQHTACSYVSSRCQEVVRVILAHTNGYHSEVRILGIRSPMLTRNVDTFQSSLGIEKQRRFTHGICFYRTS
jgi:hypothetical protein